MMGINKPNTSFSAALSTLLFIVSGSLSAEVSRIPAVFCNPNGGSDSVYSYTLRDISDSRNISLSRYSGKQEPGNNKSEIENGIKHVRPGNGFVPNFQLSKKVQVNGENEDPLFTYLKRQCPPTRDGFVSAKNLYYTPIMNNDIRWNWEKFLIDKNGKPYKRYDPSTHPDDIRNDIEILIQNDNSLTY